VILSLSLTFLQTTAARYRRRNDLLDTIRLVFDCATSMDYCILSSGTSGLVYGGVRLNELALFAGAGGGLLGSQLLSWRTVCAVEINTYARSILCQRQNDGIFEPFPIWDDICTFDGVTWRGVVDVVSGGFPCQAFSSAARGRNVADNLWPEMLRVIGEVSPRYVIAENVSEDAIIQAQADLADCGYKTCRVAVSARDIGADHIRKRWWMVADSNNKGELGGSIDAEVAKLKERCEMLWKSDPRDSRVAHGVANRVDRLKAIGNGQVSQAMALAWNILTGEDEWTE